MTRRRVPRLLLVLATALAAVAPVPASGQINYFGRNKVHHRDFDWRVLAGEHIDVYYYPEEEELARVSLTYAEQSFTFLEQKFGHSPPRRIPLFVYATHADFEQTNILPFVPPEAILGVTEFLKSRVALPFKGNYAQFRHTLRHELVHAFQLSVLSYNARTRPRRQRARVPLWWSEGLAEFWSGGEDATDEMVLRAATIAGRIPTFQQLTYEFSSLVYPLGGAIHRWLADRFGEWRIQTLYRDLWKYRSFEEALEGVYGVDVRTLSDEPRYHMRRRYFPEITDRKPLDVTATRLASFASRPVSYWVPGDTVPRYLFLSPRTGYMNIYAGDWFRPNVVQPIVKGERSAEFESFHTYSSRIDVRDGLMAFASKYLDRDALFLWDLERNKVVGRYQFPDLVSVLSPSWAPDGKSVVFSGLTMSGFSDLYRLWLTDGRLDTLTHDRHEDIDPSFSPDGRAIVFASDRTTYGPTGAHNLYVLDLASGGIRHVTYGPWGDQTPRWASNGRIYFSSDRDGVSDIYSVDEDGMGWRETHTLTGAFDPQWIDVTNELLFTGFSDFTFNIYRARLPEDSAARDTIALAPDVEDARWSWPELDDARAVSSSPKPYQKTLSLDFAAGDAVIAPGIGSAQGAVFLFSDLLSDHLLQVAITSFQSRDLGGLLENLNSSVFYLNQKRRLNWGAGAFRLKGRFYEGDFRTIFDESSIGGFGAVRWPFNAYERVEGQVRFERSDRTDFAAFAIDDDRRVGWLASNYVSYVKDNSLWLATGPIDGQRTNITAGITNDLSNGRFDAWTLSIDHRRYFRIGQRSAYSVRALGYYGGGSKPRRLGIGGPWGLRGYPRLGPVSGTRLFMLNQELRFPLANFISIGFPFGQARFPGIQGALFVDAGRAWTEGSQKRDVLGSAGLGLRMPVLFPLVLRLDLGVRFDLGDTDGYFLSPVSRGGRFVDFFFGFNY